MDSQPQHRTPDSDNDDDDDFPVMTTTQSDVWNETTVSLPHRMSLLEEETFRADRLSTRLLQIDDDDELEHDRVLRESLQLQDDSVAATAAVAARIRRSSVNLAAASLSSSSMRRLSRASLLLNDDDDIDEQKMLLMDPDLVARRRMSTMLCLAAIGLVVLVGGGYAVSVKVVGPPNQPVGPYQLVELQEGSQFFEFYTFYDGKDSAGSAGYNTYVSRDRAQALGIVNVSMEPDVLDAMGKQMLLSDQERPSHRNLATKTTTSNKDMTNDMTKDKLEPRHPRERAQNETSPDLEPFVYMSSASTDAGPRESIRLEGIRRFNRGLFIIDVRHMPAGCGVWPAFWLVDEQNWPVNGEIDIVEGVNYQSEAKTALHSTNGCSMESDIPFGVMTGGWDTAQGIPNSKTGIPDMTMRYAKNCFVYDPHQWLNQGCVAVSDKNDTLGGPLNDNGGGVFALEWDPINRHIRSWAFTPHTSVPDNLVQSIRTAHLTDINLRVVPDPEQWPLPYGYFAVGDETSCPASHFKNMRLVINTAFCGSVAGNRFQMDCPAQAKEFKTCNDYLKSQPDELNESYWKIRGVYVYEREWEREWLH